LRVGKSPNPCSNRVEASLSNPSHVRVATVQTLSVQAYVSDEPCLLPSFYAWRDSPVGLSQMASQVGLFSCSVCVSSQCPISRASSTGRCNTIWYKAAFKGGVYDPSKGNGLAFRRRVGTLTGRINSGWPSIRAFARASRNRSYRQLSGVSRIVEQVGTRSMGRGRGEDSRK